MITADDLARRLAGLEAIGNEDGAITRLAWTPEDEKAGAWFEREAARIGLRVERDPAGNRWAMPEAPGPWWVVGSHLDSVREGGRFDGPLGVATGFAVAEQSSLPITVVSFADEEGGRYNTPTFGSRALTGILDVDDVLGRVDETGTSLAEAMASAGVDPALIVEAPAWIEHVKGFIELHIDQTKDVAKTGRPYGVATGLAARRRLAIELTGNADHAGTTTMSERRDALAAMARLTSAALEAVGPEIRMTPTRVLVEPNALTTIASKVRLWIDLRAPTSDPIEAFQGEFSRIAREIEEGTGVEVAVEVASNSAGTEFDPGLRASLSADDAPEVLCFAGHDAGMVAALRPAAMVLVRNETGISHSPAEEVSFEDAAAGATAILEALERIGGQ